MKKLSFVFGLTIGFALAFLLFILLTFTFDISVDFVNYSEQISTIILSITTFVLVCCVFLILMLSKVKNITYKRTKDGFTIDSLTK